MELTTQLLTRQDVARILGVHRDTVRRLQNSGVLPAGIRVGRQVRIEADALAAYLEANRETCGQAPQKRDPAVGPGGAGTAVDGGRNGAD